MGTAQHLRGWPPPSGRYTSGKHMIWQAWKGGFELCLAGSDVESAFADILCSDIRAPLLLYKYRGIVLICVSESVWQLDKTQNVHKYASVAMFITSTYAFFTLNKPRTSRWLLTLVWIAATSSWWRCSRGTPSVGWWTSTSGKCDPPRTGRCRPGKRKSSPAPPAEWTQPPSLLPLPLIKSMGITHWQHYFPCRS